MRFTFTSYLANGLKDITTRIVDLPRALFSSVGDSLHIKDERGMLSAKLENREDFEAWLDAAARSVSWADVGATSPVFDVAPDFKCNWLKKDSLPASEAAEALAKAAAKLKGTSDAISFHPGDVRVSRDAINPSHYQAYLSVEELNLELQWLETMGFSRFRSPERMLPALELQIRKYMDREGGKDPSLQEMQKALWYMQFKVAYMKNGCKPIRVKDIPRILAEK